MRMMQDDDYVDRWVDAEDPESELQMSDNDKEYQKVRPLAKEFGMKVTGGTYSPAEMSDHLIMYSEDAQMALDAYYKWKITKTREWNDAKQKKRDEEKE